MLRGWLERRVSAEQLLWIDQRLSAISSEPRQRELSLAVALAPRKLGKADLELSADERAEAERVRAGLDTTGWSVDQTARILFALASYKGDAAAFASGLDFIFQSGEISEHIALLRGLPLYPASKQLVPRAAEGLRSAMGPVFESVAHRNPFPKEEFNEAQWNQMVLKAFFIESVLAPIQGIDERRNPDLASTLIDYVHERWAAGRAVSPEIWRCIGPYVREQDLATLVKALRSNTEMEANAAALSLSESTLPAAQQALKQHSAVVDRVANQRITWNSICR